MISFFKKQGYRNTLTKWYIGFFTFVVIGFTSVLYLHIRNQTWDKFDYGISQLGEEMLEELMNLRDDLDLNDMDTITWTPEFKSTIRYEIMKEVVDESIDNQLEDVGFVQIKNLLSGQLIYQSPEIKEHNIQFVEPAKRLWGYRQFEFNNPAGEVIKGLGYSGIRITKHYFVGLIADSEADLMDKEKIQILNRIIYIITEAIDRQGNVLLIDDKEVLTKMVKDIDAWAYVYIYETDQILWATRELNSGDIYIPSVEDDSEMNVMLREIIQKEYFYDLKDNRDYNYRQYTLIYDIIPTYLYRVDLAVPTNSVRNHLVFFASVFALGAFLLIVIVWIGGYILTRRALRPVDEVIRSVNDITSKNLDKRLPLPDLENEITRLVNTFNELLDRLAGSFRMQKTFIADASHELRTPLSIVMSDIETAMKDLKNPLKMEKILQNTTLEIERMARIVDDLHLLAKSDSGQINLNKTDIRLDEVLMATVSRCQTLASKKNIKIKIKDIEIIEYYGDEDLLIRALSNLVNNAIKYSDENEIVELSLFIKNATACFEVSDRGIGISEKDLDKIFDRFYRVDTSRSRKTGGSGLGLAIVKWICEMHQGSVTVVSKSGQGSTFTITLALPE